MENRRRSLGAIHSYKGLLQGLPPNPKNTTNSNANLSSNEHTSLQQNISNPSATNLPGNPSLSKSFLDTSRFNDDEAMNISPVKEVSNFNWEQQRMANLSLDGNKKSCFTRIENYENYKNLMKQRNLENEKPLNNSNFLKGSELIKYATQELPQYYNKCNSEFNWLTEANPRRVLTKPAKPCLNDGFDNEDNDYILYVNDILGSKEHQQYQILDILGQGTFGQVVKCLNLKTKELVAVKVIKNKPAYYNQSLVEVAILDMLNSQHDPKDQHHIARMKDTFVHKSHLCITFEMLSLNLYELIKQNRFTGFSTNLVRVFMSQILDALTILARARIIHCDLKPENILLKDLNHPNIKVIDFGSACHEGQTLYSYIQSRFYRSPEVLLGLPYTSSIDMWSVGCIAAELYLGLPLFPGSSEYNQVCRIVETLSVPPAHMIEKGKSAKNFFELVSTTPERRSNGKLLNVYKIKSLEQYQREQNTVEQPSKRYLQGTTLEEVIMKHEGSKKGIVLSTEEIEEDRKIRICFLDFLKGLLNLNPLERWSPQQAKLHPFVSGEPFTGPFKPTVAITRLKQPSSMVSRDISMMKSGSVKNSNVVPVTSSNVNMMSSNASSSPLVPPQAGGGAVRTTRQRANTLSSSKVAIVPPTLQRLVAMQQAVGVIGGRGLKNQKGGWTEEKSGRISTGTVDSRGSPIYGNKREHFDEEGNPVSKSGRFNQSSPHSHLSSDIIYTYPRGVNNPQLQISTNSISSHLNMPNYSPTTAMMDSPINRNYHTHIENSTSLRHKPYPVGEQPITYIGSSRRPSLSKPEVTLPYPTTYSSSQLSPRAINSGTMPQNYNFSNTNTTQYGTTNSNSAHSPTSSYSNSSSSNTINIPPQLQFHGTPSNQSHYRPHQMQQQIYSQHSHSIPQQFANTKAYDVYGSSPTSSSFHHGSPSSSQKNQTSNLPSASALLPHKRFSSKDITGLFNVEVMDVEEVNSSSPNSYSPKLSNNRTTSRSDSDKLRALSPVKEFIVGEEEPLSRGLDDISPPSWEWGGRSQPKLIQKSSYNDKSANGLTPSQHDSFKSWKATQGGSLPNDLMFEKIHSSTTPSSSANHDSRHKLREFNEYRGATTLESGFIGVEGINASHGTAISYMSSQISPYYITSNNENPIYSHSNSNGLVVGDVVDNLKEFNIRPSASSNQLVTDTHKEFNLEQEKFIRNRRASASHVFYKK
ncbi:dual specificity protein kinase yak1 [Clydaea vesicula]|uniref:Dual specificity protein kinase yak1 n=1 Tax=Clydaea vesicula TaxID=447962 RepID=A0AAD5UAH8_9FUNG|nr:dual specificity protein kinase yak1 [Clydaea vesicula]